MDFLTTYLHRFCCSQSLAEWSSAWSGGGAIKQPDWKTNTLVAVGSAIYVMLGQALIREGHDDVTRVLGQVVVGVGFLGARVILRAGGSVHGLNTVATVWVAAFHWLHGWVWLDLAPLISALLIADQHPHAFYRGTI